MEIDSKAAAPETAFNLFAKGTLTLAHAEHIEMLIVRAYLVQDIYKYAQANRGMATYKPLQLSPQPSAKCPHGP